MQDDILHHRHFCKGVPRFQPVQPLRKLRILKKSQMARLILVFELSGQKPRQLLRAVLGDKSFHEEAQDFQLP